MAVDWKPVRGEKLIYVRDYGTDQVYQIVHTMDGKRRRDTVGALPIDQVRIIRDQLIYIPSIMTGI